MSWLRNVRRFERSHLWSTTTRLRILGFLGTVKTADPHPIAESLAPMMGDTAIIFGGRSIDLGRGHFSRGRGRAF